ncbi:MAG: bifunctional phosphoribosylaminoimidazolecarboxamide formyltransferase/IMP cyclohydrolase [Alphaproteobacteria bacterium]
MSGESSPNHPIKRALISVSDKTGLIDFARELKKAGVHILSTGGTAKALTEAGVKVEDVSAYTQFPEMLDGRVKTLHPRVHGALLGLRTRPAHARAMREQGIEPIDLLAVNLYPFEQVSGAGADFETCIENIDIGGPAMIRAAAKNHADVTVIVEPKDYETVLNEMRVHRGATTEALRRRLAMKAYARTADYDGRIASWFAGQIDETPEFFSAGGHLRQALRYGENPHQKAAFYVTGEAGPSIASAHQIQGKELSFNNINDAHAAFELVSEFPPEEGAAAAIIKHANPCGVAVAETALEAYERALACDPVSAFGGVIAFNGEIGEDTARKVTEIFTEIVIAPAVSDAAREVFAAKKNLRVLVTDGLADPARAGTEMRSAGGGLLVQSRDNGRIAAEDLRIVTERQPTEQELADMIFAFRVAKHVKSNAIVYARGRATAGVGAGQMSRLDSSRLAAQKSRDAAEAANAAEPATKGSVVASDAFFPFADGMLAAAEAGATAVIQPGGSMRDKEVIAAADEAGLAMAFTGMRHFRH